MSALNSISIDELIDRAAVLCAQLPPIYASYAGQIAQLRERLAQGRLHFAVLGQFNRGKSTFLNALLGREILPTSALPLTSIPTIIRYGAHDEAAIAFLDEKPPLEILGPPQRIREALAIHVTEEKNPQNRLRVKEVTVRIPSDLLRGGTVLIDTPGFGSTFVHNTCTTIELLRQCDAAFMVLSAELPITQAEVDFLREVRVYVPRIFYIYNKIDLLDTKELERTSAFIKDAIIQNFGSSPDLRLIPISARNALACRAGDDQAWRSSGMEAVRETIVQFLNAHKFFALARALNRKFTEALTHIRNGIDRELSDLRLPLQQAISRQAVMREHAEALNAAMADDQARLGEEYAPLRNCVDEAIGVEVNQARLAVERLVGRLAAHERGDARFGLRLQTSMRELIAQAQRAMTARTALAASNSLCDAAARHRATFQRIAASIGAATQRPIDAQAPAPDSLAALPPEDDVEEIDAKGIRAPFWARFMPPQRRAEALKAEALPQMLEILDKRLERCAHALRSRIDEIWETYCRNLKASFDRLALLLDDHHAALEADARDAEQRARPQRERLEALAQGFAQIAAHVRD